MCTLDPDDPGDDFDALVARLDDAPIPVPGAPPVSGDEVLAVAGESMYSGSGWAPLAAALAQAERGDGSAVRAMGDALADPGDQIDAMFAYMANEVRYPRDVGRYLAEMRHHDLITEHFFFARGYDWIAAALWPQTPRGVHRGPFRHAPGARTPLVIAGTHDPATPYRWAKRYVADLGNARLLTYRADGHGALTDLDPCVGGAFLAYIETGALPPEGATCTQSVPPPADLERRAPVPGIGAWERTTRPEGSGG